MNVSFEAQALGCKILTFIFIHIYTFLLFIHYCTTGSEWKLIKINENVWNESLEFGDESLQDELEWKFKIFINESLKMNI